MSWIKAAAVALLCTVGLLNGAARADGKLVIGHDQWIGYSGMFVAQEKGFFKDQGLEVELKPFSGPGDTCAALAAGNLDVALTTLHNVGLLAGKEGVNLSVLYFIDTSSGADAVVARNGIKSVNDLKGKKVGVTLGEVNQMLLLTALTHAGMQESDVDEVNMSADDAGAAFVAGQFDAVVTWEPWVSKAVSSGAGHTVFTSADVPNVILDAVVVTDKTLSSRQGDIEKLIKGIDRGVKYLRANPKEGMEIIGKALGAKPEDVDGMLKGDRIYDLDQNKAMFGTADKPGEGVASMGRVVEFLTSKKLVKEAPDTKKILNPKLVNE